MLERATTAGSYRRIVEELGNPAQIGIVTAPEDQNLLVLAGPGSGKTRVVVHRCAYLLRVLRVSAQSLLILCYNRYAAIELRTRLRLLLGDEAAGVAVLTYHALALRLTGRGVPDRMLEQDGLDGFWEPRRLRDEKGLEFRSLPCSDTARDTLAVLFKEAMAEAVRLLRGEADVMGDHPDALRDRLLAGYRYILVDEYQDIDQTQYDLISALAGRVERDPERKLTILSVGDDDQNIYAFRDTSVAYIRQFERDYRATLYYLTENYRSTGHIIAAANQLIGHNRDRMKTDYPIVIDRGRASDPPGGRWSGIDPQGAGWVRVVAVTDAAQQAAAVPWVLKRLMALDPGLGWDSMAVLARTHETLYPLRAACEAAGIPVSWGADRAGMPRLHRIREIDDWLGRMKPARLERRRASELLAEVPDEDHHPWYGLLRALLEAWRDEAGDVEAGVGEVIDWVYETLAEQRRAQRSGRGVFLATAHAVKGMEFDHVCIVDGDWRPQRTPAEQEGERRLYYVAMTRARQSLWLFQREDQRNPHVRLLGGDHLLRERPEGLETLSEDILRLRYELLGMGDLHLDYAAQYREEVGETLERLAALGPGSALRMVKRGGTLDLIDETGYGIARLSREARKTWEPRLPFIREVRVLAMVRRRREDSDQPKGCHAEVWELPLAEVVYTGGIEVDVKKGPREKQRNDMEMK
jgi:ATP-dependent DNA helicase RecQ